MTGRPSPRPVPTPAEARRAAWEAALGRHDVPDFVATRLRGAAAGGSPWTSTMKPAELLLVRRHGLRPVAVVSGTCWFQAGSWSMTNGEAGRRGDVQGWSDALARVRAEARAAGAQAVVDLRFRQAAGEAGSRDHTLVGTAIHVEGLPPGPCPAVTTLTSLAFVRLLQAGIVPVGVGFGTHTARLQPSSPWRLDGAGTWWSQPLPELGRFWEGVRRQALARLTSEAAGQGRGVLAHGWSCALRRIERDKAPPLFVGSAVVLGTIVDAEDRAAMPHPVATGVEMHDRRDVAPRHRDPVPPGIPGED